MIRNDSNSATSAQVNQSNCICSCASRVWQAVCDFFRWIASFFPCCGTNQAPDPQAQRPRRRTDTPPIIEQSQAAPPTERRADFQSPQSARLTSTALAAIANGAGPSGQSDLPNFLVQASRQFEQGTEEQIQAMSLPDDAVAAFIASTAPDAPVQQRPTIPELSIVQQAEAIELPECDPMRHGQGVEFAPLEQWTNSRQEIQAKFDAFQPNTSPSLPERAPGSNKSKLARGRDSFVRKLTEDANALLALKLTLTQELEIRNRVKSTIERYNRELAEFGEEVDPIGEIALASCPGIGRDFIPLFTQAQSSQQLAAAYATDPAGMAKYQNLVIGWHILEQLAGDDALLPERIAYMMQFAALELPQIPRDIQVQLVTLYHQMVGHFARRTLPNAIEVARCIGPLNAQMARALNTEFISMVVEPDTSSDAALAELLSQQQQQQ